MLRDETACADNIEGGNTEKTLGVVCAFGFEDLGADGYGAVDWVCNDENVGFWGGVCNGFGEVSNDRGVGIEKVCRWSLLEGILSYGRVLEMRERSALPSRVMPGFLGTPAGMRTISAPVRACFKPSASGW